MKRFAMIALGVLGLACQSASDPATDPVWGRQACASCAMLISEPRFAAQILTTAGEHVYFDDPGCMAAYLSHPKVAPQKAWVRDTKGNWIATDHARFSKGARTPMDYGFEFSETGELAWGAIEAASQDRQAHGNEP